MRLPFGLYRVEGESMLPAYEAGDLLLGWRLVPSPHPHQVVVVRHEGRSLVKRLVTRDIDGIRVVGDNPLRSTDSRHFGVLPHESLEAVIIARIVRAR
jgi:phage repressor protein C with HTH and peptisase S24 domain